MLGLTTYDANDSDGHEDGEDDDEDGDEDDDYLKLITWPTILRPTKPTTEPNLLITVRTTTKDV